MVLQPDFNNKAGAATQEAAALADIYIYETLAGEESPSLSLYSTPALSLAPTPETPFSNYDGFSPTFPSGDVGNSLDCFGSDYPIFAGPPLTEPMQATLVDAPLKYQNALYSPAQLTATSSFDTPTSTSTPEGVFVNLSEIESSPATHTLFDPPPSPALSLNNAPIDHKMPPAITRCRSDSSVFAVPKLPRGRKRKVSVDATSVKGASPLPQPTLEDEEDEKVKARAKNTESAARSRLRKKLELSQAVQRAEELEEQMSLARLDSAKKQRRIQDLELQVSQLIAQVEEQGRLLASFQT